MGNQFSSYFMCYRSCLNIKPYGAMLYSLSWSLGQGQSRSGEEIKTSISRYLVFLFPKAHPGLTQRQL